MLRIGFLAAWLATMGLAFGPAAVQARGPGGGRGFGGGGGGSIGGGGRSLGGGGSRSFGGGGSSLGGVTRGFSGGGGRSFGGGSPLGNFGSSGRSSSAPSFSAPSLGARGGSSPGRSLPGFSAPGSSSRGSGGLSTRSLPSLPSLGSSRSSSAPSLGGRNLSNPPGSVRSPSSASSALRSPGFGGGSSFSARHTVGNSAGNLGGALRTPGNLGSFGNRTPADLGNAVRSNIGQAVRGATSDGRLSGTAAAGRSGAASFLGRHAASLPNLGSGNGTRGGPGNGFGPGNASNVRSALGSATNGLRGNTGLAHSVQRISSSQFLNRHAGQLSTATQNRSAVWNNAANFARSQLQSGRNLGATGQLSAQAVLAARNVANTFGGYGVNGIGNYAYRGGLPYYSYGGYGRGYPVVAGALRLAGLGYGALGYGGWGYGRYGGYGGFYPGYGYGYGYWGYPWLRLAAGIVRGAAWLVRPLFGYWGYPGYYAGYGNGGYGYGYGNYGYSAYPSYYYTTNYTSYPTYATTTTTVVDESATALAAPTDFAAQGEAEFKAGQYEAAGKSWRHALVDDPDNLVLLLLLSQAQFATGNFDEAAGAAQHALQRLPKENRNVVVANFRELYGNVQDYTDQLRALETASEKTSSPALQFLLGYHYGYLGYPKEAVRELDKGLQRMPQDALAKELRDEFAAALNPPSTGSSP